MELMMYFGKSAQGRKGVMSPRMRLSVGGQCTNQCCLLVLHVKELCVGDPLSLGQRKILVVRYCMFQGSKCGWKPKGVRDGTRNEAER